MEQQGGVVEYRSNWTTERAARGSMLRRVAMGTGTLGAVLLLTIVPGVAGTVS